MKITFKLYASLTDYLPAAVRADNRMDLTLADGATVGQVIEPFWIARQVGAFGLGQWCVCTAARAFDPRAA